MRQGAGLVAAHALPAAVFWTAAGALLGVVAPARPALAVGLLYALGHGLAETFGLPVRPPGVNWQVPSSWLEGRSPAAKITVWGALLGPGVFTLNVYAGMWFVLLLLAGTGTAEAGAAAGVMVGLAHGTGRAVGVLRNIWRTNPSTAVWDAILAQAHWRIIDGVALLFAAAVLALILL